MQHLLRLRSELAGDLVLAGDRGYDQARATFHNFADQRPVAVAFPESVEDVVTLVRFAGDDGLRVSPQGNGHQGMAFGALDDAIVVKTTRMRSVRVDAQARRARVGAGTPWGDVTPVAGKHGLAALSGTSPDVGVVGYHLGGGIGWLGRRFGFACNSATGFEVVTADGRRLRADADAEAELFWALRGGGGTFAVVTALEFSLYPVSELYAGGLFWPWERGSEVLHRWREWSLEVPDTVTTSTRLMQFPPFPQIPEPLRGRQFAVVEAALLEPPERCEQLLRPLRDLRPELDTLAMMPPERLSEVHMDPREPVLARLSHQVLQELPAEGIDALVAAVGPPARSPLVFFELRRLGGAYAVSRPHHGLLAAMDAPFLTFGIAWAMDDDMAAAARSHLDAIQRALAPWEAERMYLNFAEEPTDIRRLFDPATYRRLQAIKARYDPDNAVLASHTVAPETQDLPA